MKSLNSCVSSAILKRLREHYRIEMFRPHLKVLRSVTKNQIKNQNLTGYQYLITYDINCPLSYLFLTRNKDKNQCVYITKDGVMECFHQFHDSVHIGDTLLQGHILGQQYIVTDIVIYNNTVQRSSICDRLQQANHILDHMYRYDPILSDGLITLVDYIEHNYLESFWKARPQSLPITGLIFIPTNGSTECMRINNITDSNSSLPETASREITFTPTPNPKTRMACFQVRATGKSDVYHIYLRDIHNSQIKYDTAGVPDKSTSMMLYELFKKDQGNGILMICEYDINFGRWIPRMTSKQHKPDYIGTIV